jgi:membrane-associated phospholipid phosphatase
VNIDEGLLRAARTRCHGPVAERSVARFSSLGEHAGVWFAIGAVGCAVDRPRRSSWRGALRAVALTYALNTVVKLAVRRRRPALAGLDPVVGTPTALSFPSAHASTSFAGALAYARLGLPAPAVYALAASLACSRVYLGVHYPSDVAAGALLGTLVAAFSRAPRPLRAGEPHGSGG